MTEAVSHDPQVIHQPWEPQRHCALGLQRPSGHVGPFVVLSLLFSLLSVTQERQGSS